MRPMRFYRTRTKGISMIDSALPTIFPAGKTSILQYGFGGNFGGGGKFSDFFNMIFNSEGGFSGGSVGDIFGVILFEGKKEARLRDSLPYKP